MKVQINETPAADTRGAVEKNIVVDALGRRIELEEPDILDHYDLVEGLGGELSSNRTYVAMVSPLLYVKTLDGERFEFQATKRGVRAAIKQLGNEGMAALNAAILDMFGKDEEKDDAASRATVKN